MNKIILAILEDHKTYIQRKYGDEVYLLYGPAHIVYDDYNLDNSDIQFCIIEIINQLYTQDYVPHIIESLKTKKTIELYLDIYYLLQKLLDIPEEMRYVYEEED